MLDIFRLWNLVKKQIGLWCGLQRYRKVAILSLVDEVAAKLQKRPGKLIAHRPKFTLLFGAKDCDGENFVG
jgi:hypothetical protein